VPFSYQGSTIDQPGVIATKTSNGMASQSSSNRLVVLLGVSGGGGQPQTLQYLGGPQDAENKLYSGALRTAGVRAYTDALGGITANIAYMRVNPALQAAYAVLSAALATVINLESADYGNYTNLISTQIQAGSIQGLKATVTLNSATYSQDNLYQAVLAVQYTGANVSGLVTVANASGNIQGLAGALGTETVQWTAAFATYTTIQQLANFINSQVGWTASILTSSPNGPTANALDDVTGAACKTATYVVTAILQAVVNWYNTVPVVTATRAANTGALPAIMSTPAYFTGGSDGTTTNTNWSNAFIALQNVPGARIVVPITGDASIHAMASTHCAYMSDPTIRQNRVSICGGVQGETVSQALTRAQNLNSRRVSLAWPGIQDVDAITNALTTYDPFYVAAQLAGQLSTLPITSALTRKHITAKALEGTLQSTLQKTDYDNLATNGVMATKFYQLDTGNYFGVVRSLTTWLQDTALDNLELSMVCNEDYVTVRVGDAIDALVGATGGPIGAGQAASEADSTLRQLQTEGAIVGDSNMPAYNNVVSNLSGQQVITTYDATIPAPMNFFGVGASFSAYSSVTGQAA
jgi:hypothetical protein